MRFPECCPNPVLLKSVGALPPTSFKSVLDTCSAGLQKMYMDHTLQLMLLWHFGTQDLPWEQHGILLDAVAFHLLATSVVTVIRKSQRFLGLL